MVLIYHRRQRYCTALKLFFDDGEGLRLHEVDDLWVADLDDAGQVFVEFVVEHDPGYHPVTVGVVTSNKISRCCALFLFHVFPL